MKKIWLIASLCFSLAACNQSSQSTIKREGEPDIISVNGTDDGMNAAIKKANETMDSFKQALNNKQAGYSDFCIKERFNTSNGGGEHIWIADIQQKGDEFIGVVGNLPEVTTEVKLGDTVQIHKDRISDWMYLDQKKLKGGYTIRILRDRLSDDEKKKFDTENDFIVEEKAI